MKKKFIILTSDNKLTKSIEMLIKKCFLMASYVGLKLLKRD